MHSCLVFNVSLPDDSYFSSKLGTRNLRNSGSVRRHIISVISFRKIVVMSVGRSLCRPRNFDPGSSDKATDSGNPYADKSSQSREDRIRNRFRSALFGK